MCYTLTIVFLDLRKEIGVSALLDMILQLFCLIAGFVLLIKGADIFVEGASKLASKLNIPPIVIGLTIVAFGTSAPEAAISITSALGGNVDLAVGNIIGSNIMNVLLILGITGCIAKLKVNNNTYRYEIPFVMVITLVLLMLGKFGSSIDRFDGVLLWGLFLLFLYYLYRLVKKGEEVPLDEVEELDEKDTLLRLIIMIVLGMAAIVIGSNLTIDAATYIAEELGVSQRLIGLTIIAFGTSLPELVTSMTAAWKGKSDLAIGNIVGSNIFNILFVLGTTALISPKAVAFESGFIIDGIEAKIPLLEELLDYCIGKYVILNIEIKTDKIQYPNIERMTYMMIKEKGLLDRVMFSSFHLESLLNLRELDDSIYLGYLYEDNYQVNKAKVFEYRFNGAHPKYTFLNEKEINDYLRRGIDVNTWTVDSDDIKDFLVDEGVKTIITNKDI